MKADQADPLRERRVKRGHVNGPRHQPHTSSKSIDRFTPVG